jgi:hypothetical protein
MGHPPQVTQDVSDVRWQIEELHRGVKQLISCDYLPAVLRNPRVAAFQPT